MCEATPATWSRPSSILNGHEYSFRSGSWSDLRKLPNFKRWWRPMIRDQTECVERGRVATTVLGRATRYVDKFAPAVSGAGGHNQTFSLACALVHRLPSRHRHGAGVDAAIQPAVLAALEREGAAAQGDQRAERNVQRISDNVTAGAMCHDGC